MAPRTVKPKVTIMPFKIRVKSSEVAVRNALHSVRKKLTPLGLDGNEMGTIELVLAEALNNIVQHAYPAERARGPIHILGKHKQDGLHVRIKDKGEMMPGGQPPIGMEPATDVEVDDLPEGGFGWFLIHDLAKDVQYKRVGEENCLDLRLAVAVEMRA